MWDVEYTNEFGKWWGAIPESQQDDTTAVVELLGEKGPSLPTSYSKKIQGSRHRLMRELRVQSGGRPIRVFYAFNSRRVAILLIGGDKTGENDRQFYREYVQKADNLYDKYIKHITKFARRLLRKWKR